MKNASLLCAALALIGVVPVSEAATNTYSVTTTWFEPETQPYDSIFSGTFTYDDVSKTVSNLHGVLSESMTGDQLTGTPMTWLTLNNQLATWYDATMGGTFAAAFRNPTTTTFATSFGGDTWLPGGEVV